MQFPETKALNVPQEAGGVLSGVDQQTVPGDCCL